MNNILALQNLDGTPEGPQEDGEYSSLSVAFCTGTGKDPM